METVLKSVIVNIAKGCINKICNENLLVDHILVSKQMNFKGKMFNK